MALPANHLAVNSWGGRLTYQELDTYTDRLAQYLISIGVEPGTLVPICFEKSLLPIVAMYGIFKAGSAWVTIDTEWPTIRRQQILQQVRARVVVTSKQQAHKFDNSEFHLVQLDLDLLKSLQNELGIPPPSDPSSLAYVMFTSGTTGTPKGVALEHRAVSSSTTAHGLRLEFDSESRVLQQSSLVFDCCVLEIITAFVYSGTVCIPTEDDKMSDLAGVVNRLDIDWMCITTSVARTLDPRSVLRLKTFVSGGEKVNSSDAETWVEAGHNAWSVFAALHRFGHIDSGMIGLPVSSRAWIVDPENHHRLTPVGGVGELLVEGTNLARGYLNDERRTAETFIIDPAWSVNPGQTSTPRHMYKTGDLVQYVSADGAMKCLGRKDTQTKVRGQRLELAEVEHHIRPCLNDVEQVVAEVIRTAAREVLVVFVQTNDNVAIVEQKNPRLNQGASIMDVPPEELYQVSQRLPKYVNPTLYISIPSVPRMAQSGKTNRLLLREIALSILQQVSDTAQQSRTKREPSTALQYTLRRIWARTLHLQESMLGIDDNFLEVGGDSIVAMKLVAEARKDFVSITVNDVLKAPTIAAQAALKQDTRRASIPPFSLFGRAIDVQALCENIALTTQAEFSPEQIEDVYPCTPLQEGIFAEASRRRRDYILQNLLHLPVGLRLDAFR